LDQGGKVAAYWPAINVSRRLARAVEQAVCEKHAKGHHEAIVSLICADLSWCEMGHFPQPMVANFSLADVSSAEARHRAGPVAVGTLAHPRKC